MRAAEEVLLEGIRAGQFGGESKPHGDHAMGFVAFSDEPSRDFTGHVVDIGSGAGLPSLILADAFPETTWSLIERRGGRTELLSRAIHRLGLIDRVEVLTMDVAVAGRGDLRGQADWVTARSFGPPGDTAECAAPLLRPGGNLLVSEPVDDDVAERWPAHGLDVVGLVFASTWSTPQGKYARFTRTIEERPDIPRRGARKNLLF